MRVIAGAARGRPLRAAPDTRPTADLIKGTIFSMLEAAAYKRGFEPDEEGALAAALAWPRVLDLFPGSGALGIEALSRGAVAADFVEQDGEALKLLQRNLRTTNLEERARVVQTTVERAIRGARLRGPFDLILADPPYAEPVALRDLAAALNDAALLLPSSVVVFEQPATSEALPSVGPLPLANTRTHGKTRLSLYASA